MEVALLLEAWGHDVALLIVRGWGGGKRSSSESVLLLKAPLSPPVSDSEKGERRRRNL